MAQHSKWITNEVKNPNFSTAARPFSSEVLIDDGFWSGATEIAWSGLTVNDQLYTNTPLKLLEQRLPTHTMGLECLKASTCFLKLDIHERRSSPFSNFRVIHYPSHIEPDGPVRCRNFALTSTKAGFRRLASLRGADTTEAAKPKNFLKALTISAIAVYSSPKIAKDGTGIEQWITSHRLSPPTKTGQLTPEFPRNFLRSPHLSILL
ncbi:hypothetical protein AVEN_194781-1 [Araneus ventricosus]|uniref:Uncharacterized protein n=1 Tax=Araneus ventricosus TaxID=182803 RepID=A0A4Y2B3E3_ARAVE|nr:hypothetical protein AVEN_194781-1 [Araneus ventricosus]